jgi:hypothetical protein
MCHISCKWLSSSSVPSKLRITTEHRRDIDKKQTSGTHQTFAALSPSRTAAREKQTLANGRKENGCAYRMVLKRSMKTEMDKWPWTGNFFDCPLCPLLLCTIVWKNLFVRSFTCPQPFLCELCSSPARLFRLMRMIGLGFFFSIHLFDDGTAGFCCTTHARSNTEGVPISV